MYIIKLTDAKKNQKAIIRFRQEICQHIGLNPNGPAAEPLSFATYLFAYTKGKKEPVAMIEFFSMTKLLSRILMPCILRQRSLLKSRQYMKWHTFAV